MVKNRTSLSKKRRFAVFARDDFTCRYCGENSGSVKLHVDHIIPVSDGGTNDESNLITSCQPCNAGKGATRLEKVAPTEQDTLRIAQDHREQVDLAKLAKEAVEAREDTRNWICSNWCNLTGEDEVDRRGLSTLYRLFADHEDDLFDWMEISASKGLTGVDFVRYICGIAKRVRGGE